MVAFGSRQALEERITAQRVVMMFDDDGDGAVTGTDEATLEAIMRDADDIVTGLLLQKGWSLDQLELLKEDRQVLRAWSGIAAQLAGERKPEWLDANGRGPFDAFGVRARQDLKALARGETRSVQESVAGINPAIDGEVGIGDFLFNPNPYIPGDRGPGGF